MTTLTCDFKEFKKSAHSYLAKLSNANDEEADNGFKCLTLLYIGLKPESDIEVGLAARLLETAGEKLTRHSAGLPLWDA